MKKVLKSSLSLLLAIAIIFGSAYAGLAEIDFMKLFAVRANAASVIASGTCGDNLTWTLDDEGALIISGTGDMINWNTNYNSPSWNYKRNDIKTVVVESGVTSIGSSAFQGYSSITSIVTPLSTYF